MLHCRLPKLEKIILGTNDTNTYTLISSTSFFKEILQKCGDIPLCVVDNDSEQRTLQSECPLLSPSILSTLALLNVLHAVPFRIGLITPETELIVWHNGTMETGKIGSQKCDISKCIYPNNLVLETSCFEKKAVSSYNNSILDFWIIHPEECVWLTKEVIEKFKVREYWPILLKGKALRTRVSFVRTLPMSSSYPCLISPALSFSLNGEYVDTFSARFELFEILNDNGDKITVRTSAFPENLVPMAKHIKVKLISSTCYSHEIKYSSVLKHYFEKSRLVRVDDVLAISSKDVELSHEYLSKQGFIAHPVHYFKVLSVTHVSSEWYIYDTYKVNSQFSSLALVEGADHSTVPRCMEYFYNDLPSCIAERVPFLRSYVDKFYKLLMKKEKSCSPPLFPKFHSVAVLLYGPSGCGKASVVQALSVRLSFHFLDINCYSLMADTAAASETKISLMLEKACKASPCILLLRRVEMLARDSNGLKESARVANFFRMTLAIALRECNERNHPLVVVCTTTSLQSASRSLRSSFLYEIKFESLMNEDRENILRELSNDTYCSPMVNFNAVAKQLPGRGLAELSCIFRNVWLRALDRVWRGLNSPRDMQECLKCLQLLPEDFTQSVTEQDDLRSSQLSSISKPDVRWEDIGGLVTAKNAIIDIIQIPLMNSHVISRNLRRSGILFYGPPGTGKTLLAKAVATEFSLTFISVKGPELLNMYVGQTEENIRQVFASARQAAPCVIFFDELDSIAPSRGKSGDSGGVMDRVVSQLLAELDGMQDSSDVFVIGATNRCDLIDKALLRPGRFDKKIFLGPSSDDESKIKILKALTRKFTLGKDVDMNKIVRACRGPLTGADLSSITTGAFYAALNERIETMDMKDIVAENLVIREDHFMEAIRDSRPSVPCN